MVTMVPRWLRTAFVSNPDLSNRDLAAPTRFRFDVTGVQPVNQDVVVTGQEYEIQDSPSGQPDVTFHCDTGNYILLIFGRIGVEQGVSSGRLSVEGSEERAVEFGTWFQGF